jgi:hypothetical protein
MVCKIEPARIHGWKKPTFPMKVDDRKVQIAI